MWNDIKGPVIAETAYESGQLVGKDVEVELPGLEFLTTSVQAMGNMDIPLIGLLENMEMKIVKIGIDKGLGQINKLKPLNFEFRWVQDVVKSDGTVKSEGCKAFVKAIPLKTPSLGVKVGEATEAETTYTVTRMQIYCNGDEYLCVDRLSSILRVAGTDYYTDISSLL